MTSDFQQQEETSVENPSTLAEKCNDEGDAENGSAVGGEGSKVEEDWEENEVLPIKSISLMKGSFDDTTTRTANVTS